MTGNDSRTPLLVPKTSPLVPGKMYLRLYHGRTNPEQEMGGVGLCRPNVRSPLVLCPHLLLYVPIHRRR